MRRYGWKHDHLIVFQTSPAIFGTLIETGAGHNHALRLACSLIRFGFTERTIAHHTIVMRLVATAVLVIDFHNALGRDLTTGRAQSDELVLALDHAVVAGLRIAFAQFTHRLRDRLVECETKTDVLQDHCEENGGIGTAASGLHDVGIDRERAVGDDVATLIVGNIAIVDEAQSVGVERLLVFENQRQVRAGQTQVPQASTSRSVRKLVENRIMSGCDRVLVDGGAGFRVGAPPSRRYGDSLGTVTSAEPQPSLWISLRFRKSRTACMPSTPLRLVLLPAAANPSNLHMVDYSTGLVMQRAHMAIDIAYSVRKTA